MQGIGGLVSLLSTLGVIAVIIFLLSLCSRFVRAHERIANSLDVIARKLRDAGKA